MHETHVTYYSTTSPTDFFPKSNNPHPATPPDNKCVHYALDNYFQVQHNKEQLTVYKNNQTVAYYPLINNLKMIQINQPKLFFKFFNCVKTLQ